MWSLIVTFLICLRCFFGLTGYRSRFLPRHKKFTTSNKCEITLRQLHQIRRSTSTVQGVGLIDDPWSDIYNFTMNLQCQDYTLFITSVKWKWKAGWNTKIRSLNITQTAKTQQNRVLHRTHHTIRSLLFTGARISCVSKLLSLSH